MSAELSDEILMQIFFPHVDEKVRGLKDKKTRFVHYTSAEAALNILQSREMWLRQPACMNDKLEIEHGLNCLKSCFNEDESFRVLLDSIQSGLSEEVVVGFNQLLELIRKDTYLVSISEHQDTEDYLGRLSMWRAYGKESGVAIVMNQSSFFSESDSLESYLYPVFYHGNSDFKEMFGQIYHSMSKSKEILRTQDRETLKWNILNMFTSWILTIKHPGFAEEKEWRVIHSPTVNPSEFVTHEVRSINGVPQEIYKVKFKSDPVNGITGLSPNELINRIIIGPTDYPLVMYKTFVNLLEKAGVEDAANKVWVSDIPLRK